MNPDVASTPREIELKLEIAAADVAKIKHFLSKLAATRPVTHTLVSVYFDTPRKTLRSHGLSLRVRRIGGRFVQTVKSGDGMAVGLYDRAEWEHPIAGPQPELSWTKRTALGPLLRGRLAAALRPVFETRIRRTEFRVARAGTVVAAALDHGMVRAGSGRSRLYELELELARGQPDMLFRIATALAAVAPVRLSARTKADRGYELLQTRARPAGGRTERIRISSAATCAGAFQTIARGCLRQLVVNESAVLSRDGAALHRMRVALRRLRAAIGIFAGVVRDRRVGALKTELRRIERKLGAARDLDVFIADVVEPLRRRHRDDRAVRALCAASDEHRELLYAQIGTLLQGKRFRNLELALARWIEVGPWVANRAGPATHRRDRSVTSLAEEVLSHRWRKLRRKGRHVAELSHAARHKLRIRIKKLRYGIEFFSDVFPGKKRANRCRAALAALVDLQDLLGELNDLAKRESLWTIHSAQQRTPERGDAATAFAAPLSSVAQRARTAELLDQARMAFKRFRAVTPFWR